MSRPPALVLCVFVCLAGELFGQTSLSLREVAIGFIQPVFVTHAGDESGRLFVLEQAGRIRIVKDEVILTKPFLDLRGRVDSGGERGLLGLAFHPEFAANRRFFVDYTRQNQGQLQTVVSEFRASSQDPDSADSSSERILLVVNQPSANHNAGMLAFGPDGFLYISLGDGGGAGDPFGNGQNLGTLLGSILRIDVDHGNPYGVPQNNPFLETPGARGEIWAYGLRNPWRFSFDRLGGRLFVGDVGQSAWEEIDLVRAGSNYGWNTMEGNHCFNPPQQCDPSGLTAPLTEYSHAEGVAVTGGYVYRGRQGTEAWGSYIFGDFGSGRIWNLTQRPGEAWRRRLLLKSDLAISSFGEDEQGEIYAVDRLGRIMKLIFGSRRDFAQAGDGPSPAGVLRSTVVLVNQDDHDINGTLRFFSEPGTPATLTLEGGATAQEFPFTIAAGSSLLMKTGGHSDPLFVGSARVESDGKLSASIVLSLNAGPENAVSEAGVAASEPALEISGAVIRSRLEELNTGIAIFNPDSEQQVSVTLEIKDRMDALVATDTIELGPLAHAARFLDEIAALPAQFEGTILIHASGPIAATLLRTRRGIASSSLPVSVREQ